MALAVGLAEAVHPAQYDALPGMAFPAPADTYPTKDPVADYLQAYATAFNLAVRLNARVTRLGLLRVTVTSRLGRRMSRRDFVIGSNRRRLGSKGVRFRPRLVDAEGRTVRFADHRLLEDVGVVVWATGYRSDYAWIHIPGGVREGHVVHRRGVTQVPGLYFLGLSWQHTRGSALLGFVQEDAALLGDRIQAHHQAAASVTAGVTQQRST